MLVYLTPKFRYFNTVGSKEGWTPSTFVSSRTNRHTNDTQAKGQRPEDFMDEEDLADAEEARTLQTTEIFGGTDLSTQDGLAGLFQTTGNTMGVQLLRKMGWKEGQGIGPKVRRTARLGLKSTGGETEQSFLFAPEDVPMIKLSHKTDQKGLGHGEDMADLPRTTFMTHAGTESDSDKGNDSPLIFSRYSRSQRKKTKLVRGGIGIGVLNDTGSDDEDPFELGPKISYNKVIGGDKKKTKKTVSTVTNPSVQSAPVFVPRKKTSAKTAQSLRKCHDGRLPILGFCFGTKPDRLIDAITSEGKYPPLPVPAGWKSTKVATKEANAPASSAFKSAVDAARQSNLDPSSRAEILGETPLPGKSVFDFLSADARDRLAAASGNTALPAGKGEIPAAYTMTPEEKAQNLMSQVPNLDQETAVAALRRGTGPGAPYADNEAKRDRYRKYLEYHAGYSSHVPARPEAAKDDVWLNELQEFYSCARIFRPMSGAMASRFTTSSSSVKMALAGSQQLRPAEQSLPSRPALKDPVEEAAKMGMYGPMTRSVDTFYPTRLLCKRFNVKPPAHSKTDREDCAAQLQGETPFRQPPFGIPEAAGTTETQDAPRMPSRIAGMVGSDGLKSRSLQSVVPDMVAIDAERNVALEGTDRKSVV